LPPERLREAARDPGYVERLRRATADLEVYLASRGKHERRRIAYFSAEFALTDCIRVFSGGLGVLAGDHLKSSSDLGLPLTAVGLLYRDGYFAQYIDASGWQHETYRQLEPTLLPLRAETGRDGSPLLVGVEFPGRTVYARVWRADVGAIPLYLLDTNLDANAPDDRHITDRLYGGDLEHRLKQELILGIGGVRALEALEHPIEVFHLNEGHAAFAIVERLRQSLKRNPQFDAAVAEVTDEMTFTTHTPVEAGHDWFPEELMHSYFASLVQEMGVP
jgi:starch phosphorylase